MGAIAAAVSLADRPGEHALRAMLAEAPHRGTDQEVVTHGQTLLGVVRRPGELDATVEVFDGVAVAFTGTLDNAEELARSTGRGQGHAGSPARLLIDAFQRFGGELPLRLRGAYAAVVSDGRHLVCFRDHLGYGSLFHRRHGRAWYVASEAKQVVAGTGICRAPDLDVVERIFYRGDDDDAMPSALAGVERVPKTTTVISDGSAVRAHCYWNPADLLETAHLSADEVQDRFDELMTQAARRMVTGRDVVTLSGGIDSPAIAAYAAPVHLERMGTPLQALTFAYPDHPSVDEQGYAELVARHVKIPHHVCVHRARLLDRLDEWMRLVDGPVYSMSLPHYEAQYRQARALGARTVLSGETAEYVIDRSRFLIAHLLTHRRPGALLRRLRYEQAQGASLSGLGRALLSPLVPTRLTARSWQRERGDVPAWVDLRRANEASVRFLVPAADRWGKLQLNPFTACTVNSEAEAICQEVCGVRARRPWTDIDLWEFFLSLPAEVKFPVPQRKGLVRRLLRGRVPDAILDRRDKTVFNEAIMADVNYAALDRWLLAPPHRIAGVDYRLLADRLQARDLALGEYRWARNLAAANAFLSTC
jgi:asparagine synthase (glutamine-hydrolysing)